MTEESILHFASQRSYGIDYTVLRGDDALFNLLYDMVHVKKYLNWHKDNGYYTYTITTLGEIRNHLYRLNYAKNHEPKIYDNRLMMLKSYVTMHPTESEKLKSILGKNNLKLFNKAFD